MTDPSVSATQPNVNQASDKTSAPQEGSWAKARAQQGMEQASDKTQKNSCEVLAYLTYAGLQKSGLVPKAVLEYIRARQFDRVSAIICEDIAGRVSLNRLRDGSFNIDIAFRPNMTEADFEMVKDALYKLDKCHPHGIRS